MNKISVAKTIAFGFAFLVVHFRTVVRVCWIPAGLSAALDYLSRRYMHVYRAELAADESAPVLLDMVVNVGGLFAMLFLSSVAAVGITRAALGLPTGEGAIYFPLGRTELRMFWANIRYFLGIVVLVLIAAIVSLLAFLMAGLEPGVGFEEQQLGVAAGIAGLLSLGLFAYVFVAAIRMGFFLPATIVAETEGGIRRAHELTKGISWQVVLIALALMIPLALVVLAGEMAILYTVFGSSFFDEGAPGMLERLEPAVAAAPLMWALFSIATTVLTSGLMYSAAAFAYRTISPMPERIEDITPPP